MSYLFEPRTVEQEGVEDNGHLWEITPTGKTWVCMCHKDDWAGIALGLTLRAAYTDFAVYPADGDTWRTN